ncbi:MAG: S9 family peptidase [Ardenticatenaceae bacterium]|nr:S9 family peptidase [Ardenticatenaceae bacterium]
MAKPQVAPYGSWKSPITSDLIVAETVGLGQIVLDGRDVYWLELRPTEGGRIVIVRRTPDGQTTDVTPPPFNARTRVHEYGGGAFAVSEGTVFFSNFADQRLYRQDPGAQPRPITPEAALRYADGVIDRPRARMICVREDHRVAGEVVNTIVSLDLQGSEGGTVLASGNDFYSSPGLNPDGSRLAWLTWNHPNMPWDGTELWVGEVQADGSLGRTECVAGGSDESIFQPEWSPDGELTFISDRTGWWNLYRWRDGQTTLLTQLEAEFGQPQWVFGMSTYAFESPGRIICTYTQEGSWHLASLDPVSGALEPIASPYTEIASLRAAPGWAVFLAGSPVEALSIVQLDLATGQFEVLRRASEVTIDSGYLSIPEAIEFPTENGLTAHAFYYPPANRGYVAPEGERPPLLVMSHGGPTSATTGTLDLETQYWTSRGIAVLDVNYGGSTGYGRAYRERLNDRWGVVDLDDSVNGARFLAERGEVDGNRLAIRGGSAGGYTTLCALTFRDLFAAGASYFGVSDLEALAKETHKFESRYLDRLIGPYPERRDLYQERSPINFVERLACPVIFFQGLEDEVVPPAQAETMVAALRTKGVPVAYLPFEGEQHGFRRAENIKRSLDAELYFYSKIFGFEPAEPVEPVPIDNLPGGEDQS